MKKSNYEIYQLSDDSFRDAYHEKDNSLIGEPLEWDKIVGYRECRKSTIYCAKYLEATGVMVMFEKDNGDRYWYHMYMNYFLEEVLKHKLGTFPEIDTKPIEDFLNYIGMID